MKKSFVVTLALVFVLGIAGTAFAANPFTDVPANHWAYASVSKLAQAGIVDGYGDGKFIGNSNMTRYEMAQIVAKAMANSDKADAALKAQIEKLAAEFSKELNALGVRVAQLEKKVDNVKITGEIRLSNYMNNESVKGTTTSSNGTYLRSRIWLAGQVNDSWKYTAMIENQQNLATNAQDTNVNNPASGSTLESTTLFRRAWVEGKVGVMEVTAGRWYEAPLRGVVLGEAGDGLKLGYTNKDFKFNLMAIRPQIINTALMSSNNNQVIAATATYKPGNWDLGLAYYHTDKVGAANDNAIDKTSNIFEALVGYSFDKNIKLWGQYFHGSQEINDGGKSGWAAGLDFGKLVRSKPGTWNARIGYYDVPGAAAINSSFECDPGSSTYVKGMSADGNSRFDGYKGMNIGASFVAAKNIDVNFDYFDWKHQNKAANGDKSAKAYWSYVRFYF